VDVVAHSQHQVELGAWLLLNQRAFEDLVLRDLVGQTLEQLELVVVVNEQGQAAIFLLEGDALGGGERAADWEELLGHDLAAFELVRNHYRDLVEVLHHC
jgi:hypothetical protein